MAVMTGKSFFASLTRLEAKEAARAIDFVNRFMANPAQPGISLERINSRSGRLWSGRISRDLRAIIFQDGEHWALLYADHHDDAYRWAERRSVGKHPVTGVLQVVESVEATPEVERYIPDEPAAEEPDRWAGTSIEVSTGVEGLSPGDTAAPGARPNAAAEVKIRPIPRRGDSGGSSG